MTTVLGLDEDNHTNLFFGAMFLEVRQDVLLTPEILCQLGNIFALLQTY